MTALSTAGNEIDRDAIFISKPFYSPNEFGPSHELNIGHFCPKVKLNLLLKEI